MGSYFQGFTDGTLLATFRNRRSGAQRGASENNFGQRFSVSTPCFFSRRTSALPPNPLLDRPMILGVLRVPCGEFV